MRSEHALAVYTAAVKEASEAKSLYQLQEAQLQIVQQGIGAGADNRLNLDSAQIQVSVSAQAQLDALARAQQAFGELEDSLQRPLTPGEILPIAPESASWKQNISRESR
jgi:hypothetical protein